MCVSHGVTLLCYKRKNGGGYCYIWGGPRRPPRRVAGGGGNTIFAPESPKNIRGPQKHCRTQSVSVPNRNPPSQRHLDALDTLLYLPITFERKGVPNPPGTRTATRQNKIKFGQNACACAHVSGRPPKPASQPQERGFPQNQPYDPSSRVRRPRWVTRPPDPQTPHTRPLTPPETPPNSPIDPARTTPLIPKA